MRIDCDNHLREVVRREQELRWRDDHADFIAAYNATVEAEGLPLDVQSDLLDALDTRMVIPLRRLEQVPRVRIPSRLTPVFAIESEDSTAGRSAHPPTLIFRISGSGCRE